MQRITKYHTVPEGQLAYEITGQGPVIVFLPGWPFNRHTYRKLIPVLAAQFTCINIDTLGLGESTWDKHADFSIASHVRQVKSLLDELKVKQYSLLSFDSGGAIARALAAEEGAKIANLILLNTDIPGRRPPCLPLYRLMFSSQFGRRLLNMSLVQKYVVPSNLMLGLTFKDMTVIDKEFIQLFVKPMSSQPKYFEGLGKYLRGFNLKEVDMFDKQQGVHQLISAPVHMIWGENDPVFPLPYAQKMAKNIPTLASFQTIPKTKLLAHEEQPEQVLAAILNCLQKQTSTEPLEAELCLA